MTNVKRNQKTLISNDKNKENVKGGIVMIYIEIPLWFAIISVICYIVLLIYFIIGDLLARLMHKHYRLIEKEKEELKNDK
jgi:uncharacterized membrane protein